MAAVTLKPKPADLTSPGVNNQSDGSFYYKITTGNPPMASYKKTYSLMLRTFEKNLRGFLK
jgi:hypothetical protein